MTEDLKKIDVPTLILHGDADQIVPIADSAMLSVKLIVQQSNYCPALSLRLFWRRQDETPHKKHDRRGRGRVGLSRQPYHASVRS